MQCLHINRRGNAILDRSDAHHTLRVEQHCLISANAPDLIQQRRTNGRQIAGGDRLPEAKIRHQNFSGAGQLTGTRLQQIAENVAADLQVLLRLTLGGDVGSRIDHQKHRTQNQRQQADGGKDQARPQITHTHAVIATT